MNSYPELDVPHWANAMVGNWRRDLDLPETVSDRAIYSALEQSGGMNPEDVSEFMRDYFSCSR